MMIEETLEWSLVLTHPIVVQWNDLVSMINVSQKNLTDATNETFTTDAIEIDVRIIIIIIIIFIYLMCTNTD